MEIVEFGKESRPGERKAHPGYKEGYTQERRKDPQGKIKHCQRLRKENPRDHRIGRSPRPGKPNNS
jgi:hypothetical protein